MSESETEPTFVAPEPEEVAALFPAYEVYSLIACGGMGAVYRANQSSLDREVAIKILPREFSKDEAFRSGFEQEAKAMGKLNHPNLIGVYDFGEVSGMLFIVMEYVHGQSLYQAADGNAVDKTEVSRLVAGVCRGLAHAHKYGILHRDIKPANILLNETLTPKIGDFGLARTHGSGPEEGEQIFGTPGYTAPEVTTPPFTFDQRADIFSVGAMLYQLLTGEAPIDADGSQKIPQLASLSLNKIIKKAMDPNPEARYSDADKLADDLEKIASGIEEAEVQTAQSGALRAPQTRKALAPVAAQRAKVASVGGAYVPKTYVKKSFSTGPIMIVLALAVLGGVIFFLTRNPPENNESQARTESIPDAPKVIVLGDGPAPGAMTRSEKSSVSDPSNSPLIPMILNSGPVIQQSFDVPRFLEKAQGVMKASIAPDIRGYEKKLEENANALESGLKSLTGNWEGERRQTAEKSLSDETEDWAANGFRIPKELPVGFRESFSARELYEKHLKAQNALRAPLLEKAKAQTEAYLIGLEYQINYLKDTDNETAIESLKKEIKRTKEDPSYFGSIMLN